MLQSNKLLGKTILATMFLFKLIITVRKALSYFTNKVTISLFNSVEKRNKNGLTQILPAFYRDLSEEKLNSLSEYRAVWTHIQIDKQSPSTEIGKY